MPSSFRIMRMLLDRYGSFLASLSFYLTNFSSIEDAKTGQILLPEFNTELPEHRKEQVARWADTVKDKAWSTFPFVDGAGKLCI